MKLILLAALAASMAGTVEAGRVATSPFPATRSFQGVVSVNLDGELLGTLPFDFPGLVTYSADVRHRRLGPLEMENAGFSHRILRDYGDLRVDLNMNWLNQNSDPFNAQFTYSIENFIGDRTFGNTRFTTPNDPQSIESVVFHRGGRGHGTDLWSLSNVTSPWETTRLEIFHGVLGGQEIIVSMDEYGWLPANEVSLVSTRRGAVRRSRNVMAAAALGTAAVPEPGTIGLLILGALLCPRPRHFRATAS